MELPFASLSGLFRISKIQFFESNSQRLLMSIVLAMSCSEYQRYNFLKAIHNLCWSVKYCKLVVQNIKDTIFWKQFTTQPVESPYTHPLFRISKIQFFESNSQLKVTTRLSWPSCSEYQRYNFLKAIHNEGVRGLKGKIVVQNIKDTIFWKQFTTCLQNQSNFSGLFRISKIQFFESNSQPDYYRSNLSLSCSEYQRYNFLKAIHNKSVCCVRIWKLFRISKIQFFESNSQLYLPSLFFFLCCSEYQRYNFLKAIHNSTCWISLYPSVVQNIKDTIFWKQFTTGWCRLLWHSLLFRISKIQFFESNSQPVIRQHRVNPRCSEYQRYNFLKAIHNLYRIYQHIPEVVQNIKDTIFWKQFTTVSVNPNLMIELFRISKIQFFESNSQQFTTGWSYKFVVQNIKDTIFWKQFTTL